MRPVCDVVAGLLLRTYACRGEPVVVVIERPVTAVAAVLRDERGMIELDARVDRCHDDAVTAVVEPRPDLRGANGEDVPFRRGRSQGPRSGRGRVDGAVPRWHDPLDLGE